MKQLCRVHILVLTMVALSCSVATSGDKDVLEALERIKAGIEEGTSRERLAQLLDEARTQIDTLQRGDVRKDCFRAATNRSYYWYNLGVKSWGALIENQKQRSRYARQAEYGDHQMKEISLKMVANYDTLIKRAQEALPSKWEYGNAEIDRARQCLDLK
jgi:ribosome-binding protein aMBF1 (putative translation factor)